MRRCLAAVVLAVALGGVSWGQEGLEPIAAQSFTGQFVVRGADFSRPGGSYAGQQTNSQMVALEPTLVTVSCERIKQFLSRQLNLPNDSWQSKIIIFLHPVRKAGPPTLTAIRFVEGWRYQLDLPEWLERSRYVEAVVQAILLERANRQASAGHGAEIPLWLSQGLAEELLACNEAEIILEPPKGNRKVQGMPALFLDAKKRNPLEAAHELLAVCPPLSFEELSWPRVAPSAGVELEVYRASAYIFVHGLMGLNDGPAHLRQMLFELPRYYNWQFAFLSAFQSQFQRPLEVEKWWTLYATHFVGRDVSQAWNREESWYKLDEALRPGVDIRSATNELPVHAQVTLQAIVRDWERQPQAEALRAKVRELEELQLRAAPELVSLVREYETALTTYLEKRDQSAFGRLVRRGLTPRQLVEATVRQLDELDVRREQLRPAVSVKS